MQLCTVIPFSRFQAAQEAKRLAYFEKPTHTTEEYTAVLVDAIEKALAEHDAKEAARKAGVS